MERVLVTGWPSFLHGEATAGDVLAMEAVRRALTGAGVECDLAWSPVFRPGGLDLGKADPGDYSDVVFVCGPAHGEQVRDLHRRFARCRRVAVGVSVIDPDDPAVTGFDAVLARDAPAADPRPDLSALPPTGSVPVVGVVHAPGQREYGERGRHGAIEDELTGWLADRSCALLPLDTRLDPRDWRLCTTAAELESVFRRLDLVVTTRLHGLVLALKNGVPALAVDPVGGGAKVAAQARAWGWPAIVTVPEKEPAKRPANAPPDTGPGAGADAGSGAGSGVPPETGPDAEGARPDTEPGAGSGAGTDAPPDTGSDTGADAGSDTGADAGPPLLDRAELDRWWDWALSAEGAGRAGAAAPPGTMIGELLDVLGAR